MEMNVLSELGNGNECIAVAFIKESITNNLFIFIPLLLYERHNNSDNTLFPFPQVIFDVLLHRLLKV